MFSNLSSFSTRSCARLWWHGTEKIKHHNNLIDPKMFQRLVDTVRLELFCPQNICHKIQLQSWNLIIIVSQCFTCLASIYPWPKHSAPFRIFRWSWILGPYKRAMLRKSKSHKHLNWWSWPMSLRCHLGSRLDVRCQVSWASPDV